MTDRRGHVRAVACGTARVDGARLAIRDLSAGGARLVGPAQLVEGHRVRLELTVEGATNVVEADVLRVDRQRSEAAVTFHNLSAATRAWIESSVSALIERVRAAGPPLVLVTGVPAERAATLERDLARLDRAMQRCATQAELEDGLRQPERVCAVVIGSEAPIGELVTLLRDQHPVVKRVLLFGEQLESIDHEISRRVDAVLRTPWRIRALARAIGIESADSTAAMLPQSE
jgi:PilZ domain-containing protein